MGNFPKDCKVMQNNFGLVPKFIVLFTLRPFTLQNLILLVKPRDLDPFKAL